MPVAAAYQLAKEASDVRAANVQWILVVWPGLEKQGRKLLGRVWACHCCGYRGRIEEVVALDLWSRYHVGCK